MARIPYSKISNAIKKTLEASQEIRKFDATVQVAPPAVVGLDSLPYIGILERGRTPTSGQPIQAGRAVRYTVRWVLTVSCFSAQSYQEAAEQRDDLLGLVEIALLANRTLGQMVATIVLEGGDLDSGPVDQGFIAQGTLTMSAELTASS